MAENDKPNEDKEGKELIFTSYITLKNGRKLYAHQCGKKAFAIWVKKTVRRSK